MSAPSADRRALYARYETSLRRSDQRRARRQLRTVPADAPTPRAYGEEQQIRMAIQGLLVAEELPTKARERLFAELHALGWTDLEMAEHTRTTPYTTARIRDRLGLRPNRPRAEGMTA
jgi:hypothetical protein